MNLLENETIRLRALEPADLNILYRWENDTSHWEMGNTLTPYSRHILKQYIDGAGNELYTNRQMRLMIELKKRSKATPVGTVDLYDYEPRHLRAETGILICPAGRRQGLATAALTLMTDYAFTFLHLHLLYAYIPLTNAPCLRLFDRCGFETACILKEWLMTSDGYVDVALVCRRAGTAELKIES
jgi:diamine N-acetyltransferase